LEYTDDIAKLVGSHII